MVLSVLIVFTPQAVALEAATCREVIAVAMVDFD
jgi:hypothetical protein